jgi:hypothetical protein
LQGKTLGNFDWLFDLIGPFLFWVYLDFSPMNPTTPIPPRKSIWKRFTSFLIGNRRLKSYLFTLFKFVSLTFVQANKIGMEENPGWNLGLEIVSYSFMVILVLLFTERYIREIVAQRMQKPMSVAVNWFEACVFFMYFVFSCFTTVTHTVFIILNPDDKPLTPLDKAVDIIGILINFYLIIDKAIQFTKANQSRSHYLADGRLIPLVKPIQQESIQETLLQNDQLEKQDENVL